LSNGRETTSDPQNVADMINFFFVGIVDDLLNENNCPINVQTAKQRINYCPNTIFLFPVTENEIECTTKSLKGKFSAGVDEVPEYIVKQCIQHIKKPLAHIYNASFNSGTFPERLKIAQVKPLYKKGDIHDVQNYRPISVLSVFSKSLEKLMYNRVIFFSKNNILTEAQNGFREKNQLKEQVSIQEAMDKGLHAVGLFFEVYMYLAKPVRARS
jgi:hypothetical protein